MKVHHYANGFDAECAATRAAAIFRGSEFGIFQHERTGEIAVACLNEMVQGYTLQQILQNNRYELVISYVKE